MRSIMDAARNGDAAALRDFVERRVQLAGGAISSAKRHTAGMFPSVSLARGGEPASGGWAECLYWMLSAVERDCGLHATEVWVRLSWSGDLPWTALHALMTMGSDCAPGADVKPWLSMVIALLAYGAEPRVRWRDRGPVSLLSYRRGADEDAGDAEMAELLTTAARLDNGRKAVRMAYSKAATRKRLALDPHWPLLSSLPQVQLLVGTPTRLLIAVWAQHRAMRREAPEAPAPSSWALHVWSRAPRACVAEVMRQFSA